MLEEQVLSSGITDAQSRRAFLVVRWLLLITYILLAPTDALGVSNTGLIISTAILGVYFLVITAAEMTGRGDDILPATRYIDVLATTAVVLAVHDTTRPLWAVYFLTIVGVAQAVTRREMAPFVGWCVVNFLGAAAIIYAFGNHVPWGYTFIVAGVLLGMGVNASFLAGGEQRLRDVLMRAAVTDSLTGVANRHHLRNTFSASLDEAISHRAPLAFMLIDVDHFKEINDTQGHPAGDDKLREVAQAFTTEMRAGDVLARYGGDEFSVVAPHAARSDAAAIAERLRAAARRCGASVSIGLAMFPEDAQREDALINAADRALYIAKEAGRDCVRDLRAA
jgi:diguanylate cyclase (GGDEF)-like protein